MRLLELSGTETSLVSGCSSSWESEVSKHTSCKLFVEIDSRHVAGGYARLSNEVCGLDSLRAPETMSILDNGQNRQEPKFGLLLRRAGSGKSWGGVWVIRVFEKLTKSLKHADFDLAPIHTSIRHSRIE